MSLENRVRIIHFRPLFYFAIPIWTLLILYFQEDTPEEDQIWGSRWNRALSVSLKQDQAMIYVSWRIMNFLNGGRAFCVIRKHHNYPLTSINRFFLRWGKYCMGFVAILLVQTYALWSMLLLLLYLRERLTKASITSSLQMMKTEHLVKDFRKPLT